MTSEGKQPGTCGTEEEHAVSKIKKYNMLIEAMELAKERIEGDMDYFICYALPQTPMGNYIRDHIIMPSLYPAYSLDTWMLNNRKRGSPRHRRIIWLDALIRQAKQERQALIEEKHK